LKSLRREELNAAGLDFLLGSSALFHPAGRQTFAFFAILVQRFIPAIVGEQPVIDRACLDLLADKAIRDHHSDQLY
jgi:hypothetical protein